MRDARRFFAQRPKLDGKNMKTQTLLMERLREIMSEPDLAAFTATAQYEKVCAAAENGWPFMLSKQPDGQYALIVDEPERDAV
jgi:hypothetical protein